MKINVVHKPFMNATGLAGVDSVDKCGITLKEKKVFLTLGSLGDKGNQYFPIYNIQIMN